MGSLQAGDAVFSLVLLFVSPAFLFWVPSNFAYTAEKRHEPSDSNGGSRITFFICVLGWRVLSSPLPFFLKFIDMEVTLSSSSVERIAQRVADIMLQRQTPDLCTTSEAAKILGITPAYLRRIADRYPHIKQGEGKQARLLFRKEGLL